MAQMRVIKRRIRSIDNTKQITKTMEMVAAAKIRKAQQNIESARPYAMDMIEVLGKVADGAGEVSHPLLDVHEPMKQAVVVCLTSDRGLSGAFNANVIRQAEDVVRREREQGRKVSMLTVGKKGQSYFRYVGYEFFESYRDFSDNPGYEHARSIAEKLMNAYIAREIDKVVLVFNHFKSAVEQNVVEHTLLPIKSEAPVTGAERPAGGYAFEPSAGQVLESLLPAYVRTLVYRALLESAASEHGARRTAMKNASDNAVDIIAQLTRTFNRVRQAQITQEISEIVGGAEAQS